MSKSSTTLALNIFFFSSLSAFWYFRVVAVRASDEASFLHLRCLVLLEFVVDSRLFS